MKSKIILASVIILQGFNSHAAWLTCTFNPPNASRISQRCVKVIEGKAEINFSANQLNATVWVSGPMISGRVYNTAQSDLAMTTAKGDSLSVYSFPREGEKLSFFCQVEGNDYGDGSSCNKDVAL